MKGRLLSIELNKVVERPPSFADIRHLLKAGDLPGYVLEKNRRITEWKMYRGRKCAKCEKHKNQFNFTHYRTICDSCWGPMANEQKAQFVRSKKKRSDYIREYKKDGVGLQLHCAKQVVYNLVKMGVLQKKPCEECGETKVQAHHPDYNRPWEVTWLCNGCHKDWHAKNEARYVERH